MVSRRRAPLVATLGALALTCRHPTPAPADDTRARSPATAASVSTSVASASAAPSADASVTPSVSAALAASAVPANPNPFGSPVPIPQYTCPVVLRAPGHRAFLATADTQVAFVDGDDPLALANRSPTGALPPGYAPSDLVEIRTGRPRSAAACESSHACLRRDAAAALNGMLAEMRKDDVAADVTSAFRGFGTQCWVFASWSNKARGGFCEATQQSALPGHSQHQLGTTIDLFTTAWAEEGARTGGGVFRNGFGCSPGGRWLDENSWRFGYVLPYPIHPDDRNRGSRCEPRHDRPQAINAKTGYMQEPWHLRFVGTEAAARYHDAWLASGPGSPDEITLEQWLRRDRGLVGDAELPVCDGCQCGACATLATDDRGTPCGAASLQLDAAGRARAPADDPVLLDARARRDGDSIAVDVVVRSPPHTVSQTPVTAEGGPTYLAGSTYESLAPFPDGQARAYADLAGAWRVAVEPSSTPPAPTRWPWRASLASPELAGVWNRANVLLPARPDEASVRVRIHPTSEVSKLRVTLLRDGVEHHTREIEVF
jgi:D-alanyl-D-alanine carboxypeptidase